MTKFILNKNSRNRAHPFYDLNDFAKGYVEAMFFTNGDTGDERENLLNQMGIKRLTRASVSNIAEQCSDFEAANAGWLNAAYNTILEVDYYDAERAGRDFWFSRQRHGVGYWDRGLGKAGDKLDEAAKACGEAFVEVSRGWIYYN